MSKSLLHISPNNIKKRVSQQGCKWEAGKGQACNPEFSSGKLTAEKLYPSFYFQAILCLFL